MLAIARTIISRLEEAILLYKVSRVILFGSRARGDQNVRSDIDLAFDARDLSDSEWIAILNLLEETPTLLKIDAVRYNDASDDLQTQIDQQGIVIYERH
jgi:predicted nucleotidyltransferase